MRFVKQRSRNLPRLAAAIEKLDTLSNAIYYLIHLIKIPPKSTKVTLTMPVIYLTCIPTYTDPETYVFCGAHL